MIRLGSCCKNCHHFKVATQKNAFAPFFCIRLNKYLDKFAEREGFHFVNADEKKWAEELHPINNCDFQKPFLNQINQIKQEVKYQMNKYRRFYGSNCFKFCRSRCCKTCANHKLYNKFCKVLKLKTGDCDWCKLYSMGSKDDENA